MRYYVAVAIVDNKQRDTLVSRLDSLGTRGRINYSWPLSGWIERRGLLAFEMPIITPRPNPAFHLLSQLSQC